MSSNIRLGFDPAQGKKLYMPLDKHALTIAGPRTGKGACQIIPTLREWWRGNAIVIDPKGEAVTETAAHRFAMGQRVVCLDPVPDPVTGKFCSPENVRATFNPLDLVHTGAAGYHDLEMLADALVLVTGKETDPFFNDTSRALFAGILAFILEQSPPEHRHLGSLRPILQGMVDPAKRAGLFKKMEACTGYGEIAAEAVSYMRREGGKSDSIYTTAAKNVRWLADPEMIDCLRKSSFDFHDIRTGKMDIFLVLSPRGLETHGRFLRLFVRCALSVMKQGQVAAGHSDSRPTLFLLDEFAKLGKINVIAEDAGLMPGYGVHLWPMLQGLGQLTDTYGDENAEIFLGASNAISIFGIGNDYRTAEYASRRCGLTTTEEVADDWHAVADAYEHSERVRASEKGEIGLFNPYYAEKVARSGGVFQEGPAPVVQSQHLITEMDIIRAKVGRPRFSPDDLIAITAKGHGDAVARQMIVFYSSGGYQFLRPLPYFQADAKAPALIEQSPMRKPRLALSKLNIPSFVTRFGRWVWRWFQIEILNPVGLVMSLILTAAAIALSVLILFAAFIWLMKSI